MSNTGVISVIPTRRGYEDRFKMLDELGLFVRKHLIITKDDQIREDESQFQAATHSELTALRHASSLKFIWKAYREARRFQIRSPDIDRWVVHDYLTAWTGPLLKFRPRPPTTSFLSLYFPNITMLKDRGWRHPTGKRLSFGREMRHWNMYLRRSVLEYIGALSADVIVANSDTISREIANSPALKSKSIHTMQTEVDTSVFFPMSVASNTPPHSFRILYTGSFGSRKGLPVLLRAFGELIDEDMDATLTLIGHAPTLEEIRRFDAMTGGLASTAKISFPGFLDRQTLAKNYNEADLFVFPSFYEGSPRVVKEAMACGCPAIVADIPGNRLIDPDGKVLRFYKPESLEELKYRIRDAFDDRRALRRWGLDSSEYIQRFSTSETARRLAGLYESYLESSRT